MCFRKLSQGVVQALQKDLEIHVDNNADRLKVLEEWQNLDSE